MNYLLVINDFSLFKNNVELQEQVKNFFRLKKLMEDKIEELQKNCDHPEFQNLFPTSRAQDEALIVHHGYKQCTKCGGYFIKKFRESEWEMIRPHTYFQNSEREND